MIGPSFIAELKAAGLLGLPFSWSDAGEFSFHETMATEDVNAVLAVYEMHDPKAPAPAPSVVTMRQARLALLEAGLLGSVVSAIESIDSPAARIEWDFAQTVDRSSPLFSQMVQALQLTEEQVDGLFMAASQL